MSAPYKTRKKSAWAPSANNAKDYTDADALVTDLGTGQLDLAGAERRIRALYETAFQAGVMAGAEASAEQIQKLAAENRSLRVRLVQQSLTQSAEVA